MTTRYQEAREQIVREHARLLERLESLKKHNKDSIFIEFIDLVQKPFQHLLDITDAMNDDLSVRITKLEQTVGQEPNTTDEKAIRTRLGDLEGAMTGLVLRAGIKSPAPSPD